MTENAPDNTVLGTAPQARWARPTVQAGFLVVSLLMGLQFRNFVHSLGGPLEEPLAYRPAAVEAYLPISSLMSLTYFVKTGIANRVHPAGLLLFTLILALSFTMGRGFCSWVCPIGTLAECAHACGNKIFGRNLRAPNWLDWCLRSIKYLVLAFFVFFIFRTPAEGLRSFIYGPYNRMADVKMYLFFANISSTAIVVLVVLWVLSMLFQNFWCRYLCPYGALLCLCSIPRPLAVRRDEDKCMECGRCTKACPNRIQVESKRRVNSIECTMCFRCIGACPVPEALRTAVHRKGRAVPVAVYGAVIVAAFLIVPQAARVFSYWDTDTPGFLYKHLYPRIAHIDHPRPGRFRTDRQDPPSDPSCEDHVQGAREKEDEAQGSGL